MRSKKTHVTVKKLASTASSAGAETWRVQTPDGHTETIVTKSSSAAALDRALEKYAGAMKRLAKK